MKILFVAVLWATAAGTALADCYLDGQRYEEGAVVAGFICSGGEWVAL